jgi:2Fe-2S ferredoxin
MAPSGSPAAQEPSDVDDERRPPPPRRALIEPMGLELAVESGETLIEAAWRCGYYWPTVCYGQAQCTACVVKVTAGVDQLVDVADDEMAALKTLPPLRLPDAVVRRLACRLQFEGSITVEKRGVQRQDE